MLHGHTGPITSVAATPDGRRLFTGSGDGTVRTWDLEALDPARGAWRLPGSAYGVAFSPDGRLAAATGWGGWVGVREVATGRETLSWTGHEQSGVRVAWSPDGKWLATTGNDGRVLHWAAETGRPGATLLATTGQIAGLAFSPDGAHLAAPAEAGEVRVWRIPGGELAATLKEGERSVWHVAWRPDGKTLAASGSDGATVLWDWRAGRPRARLNHGRGRVVADYHPDGTVVAAGSSGRLVTLWDAASGAKVRECAGHDEAVNAVRFSPDGARLATGADDNTLRLWNWRTCATVLSRPFPATVYDVAWSPDGQRLLVAPLDDSIVLLETRPATATAMALRPPGLVVAHSPRLMARLPRLAEPRAPARGPSAATPLEELLRASQNGSVSQEHWGGSRQGGAWVAVARGAAVR